MIEAIQTLIAAIETAYLKEPRWRAWAEHSLLGEASPPVWLVELYEADTAEQALAALHGGWQKVGRGHASLDQTSLMLGFWYLRHTSGDLTASELLRSLGDAADRHNYGGPTCEAVYSLLNEYERRPGATQYDPTSFAQKVNAMFAGHAKHAGEHWSAVRGAV